MRPTLLLVVCLVSFISGFPLKAQVENSNRTVVVSGGVREPQRLTWTPGLTLLAAIGKCGGVSDPPGLKGTRLIRDGKQIGTYNSRDFHEDPAKDPQLLPGDQVIVPE